MDKLIKASDAVDIVAKHSALYGDGEINTDDGEALLYDIMSEIMNLPSAEPERKMGKWMARNDDCFECSECHAVIEGDELYWRNNYFCYHCGADMRGDSDEQQ